MQLLLIMFISTGLLLVVLSVPMIFKWIKPNGLYGFRVKKTLENPDIWYAVNSYSGKWLLATGVVEILAAIGLFFIPGISLDNYSLSVLAIFGFVFVITIIDSVRYMNRWP
jgi:hypothetical protein